MSELRITKHDTSRRPRVGLCALAYLERARRWTLASRHTCELSQGRAAFLARANRKRPYQNKNHVRL
ncbi:unnamed protein product, partial [Brenthis ino]